MVCVLIALAVAGGNALSDETAGARRVGYASDSLGCDVWELSTRHLGDRPLCIESDDPGLQVHRFQSGCWQQDSVDRALDVRDCLPIIYVHGNFMERDNARRRVLIIDRYLRARSQRPYRIMMVSWPSQRESHPLRDVRENAKSAEYQGMVVAWLLRQLGGSPQVSLLGFSYGARSVTGGVHLASRQTPFSAPTDDGKSSDPIASSYRVGLVAPAVDRTWLLPSGKHNGVLLRTDGIISLYNPNDPVLRRFRFLDRATRPVAAGAQGFVGNPLIQQYDCGDCIGKTHDEQTYYAQCPYFSVVLDHLLWNEPLGTSRIP